MTDATGDPDRSFDAIRLRYLAFAENEAKGVSPLYEEIAAPWPPPTTC